MQVLKLIDLLSAIAEKAPEANVELATYNLGHDAYGNTYNLTGVALTDCSSAVIKLIFEKEHKTPLSNTRMSTMKINHGGDNE